MTDFDKNCPFQIILSDLIKIRVKLCIAMHMEYVGFHKYYSACKHRKSTKEKHLCKNGKTV